MIQQAGASGEVDPQVREEFVRRAEEIACTETRGVGELPAVPRGLDPRHPYQGTPPDHPLLLLRACPARVVLGSDAFPLPPDTPPGIRFPDRFSFVRALPAGLPQELAARIGRADALRLCGLEESRPASTTPRRPRVHRFKASARRISPTKPSGVARSAEKATSSRSSAPHPPMGRPPYTNRCRGNGPLTEQKYVFGDRLRSSFGFGLRVPGVAVRSKGLG